MAAPDATGDLNDGTVFLQSYHLPQNVFSTAETSVTAAAILRLHPPLQTLFICTQGICKKVNKRKQSLFFQAKTSWELPKV